MTDWLGWTELVAEELLLVVAFLVMFDGVRRLVRDGMTRWTALAVAIALVLPVWEATASLDLIRQVRLLQGQKMAALYANGREPAGGCEKTALSPADRTAVSTAVAAMNYKYLGRRTELVDEQGRRVVFDPTPQQTLDREQVLRDEKGAEDSARSAYERGMRLFLGTLGFLLAGTVVGWRQRERGLAPPSSAR
jgi:hypothetical protein